jgi:hypothetical protein
MPSRPLTNAGTKELIKGACRSARRAMAELRKAQDIYESIRDSASELLNPDYTMTSEDDAFAVSLGFLGGDELREAMNMLSEGVIGVVTSNDYGDARAFRTAVARAPVYPE